MDMIRTPYRTTIRPYADSPEVVAIRWFFAAPGAAIFPTWHHFAASVYDNGEENDGVGETDEFPTFLPGKPLPWTPKGRRFCGTVAQFQGRASVEDERYQPGMNGFPRCCFRVVGNLALGGGAESRDNTEPVYIRPEGGVEVGGSATVYAGDYPGTGGVEVGGSAPVTTASQYPGAARIEFTGFAQVIVGDEYPGTGGVEVGGEAEYGSEDPEEPTEYEATTTGTWTVPDGVTSLTVEVWGAGGNAGSPFGGGGAGGAGGGAYARSTITVTPGQTIYLDFFGFYVACTKVLAGPSDSTEGAKAASAFGSFGSFGGAGGSSGASIGQTVYSGGNGGNGSVSGGGGGGGGSATATGNGTNGSDGTTTGGSGAAGQVGTGGNGGDNGNGNGANATGYGNGGGGGGASSGTGGTGSAGRVRITW